MTWSKALEVNLEASRCEVTLDPKYAIVQDITSNYQGLLENLNSLLREVCHPYKNWSYIIVEARRFALHNFNLFKNHPKGPEGSGLFMDIFLEGAAASRDESLQADALDNLLVYLEQIITEADDNIGRFDKVINYGFEKLISLDRQAFFLIVKSFYSLNRIIHEYGRIAPSNADFSIANKLLKLYLNRTYKYWLAEPDPAKWFLNEVGADGREDGGKQRLIDLFTSVSHEQLKKKQSSLGRIKVGSGDGARDVLNRMAGLPGFRDIVSLYEALPRKLAKAGEANGAGDRWFLVFLFHIMNLSGLSSVHERALRDINRTLTRVIDNQDEKDIRSLIGQTFRILKKSFETYPNTALNLLLNMGQAVYRTDDSDLVEFFIQSGVELGFHTPDLGGVGEDWEVKVNAAHVQNIRTWMKIIELNPRWSKKLLSALVIHLALYGVFIKDTDIFPRDITRFLNGDIGPVYNLVKQLCRLFPAYFNEIGAEGKLRDISTQLDEIVRRRDPLIHFLRKQSHVESSPQTVTLMEAIFEFWRTKEKGPLQGLVPPDIFESISEQGPDVDGLHALIQGLYKSDEIENAGELLSLPDAILFELIPEQGDIDDIDRQRFLLAQNLYQMLYQKYNTDIVGLDGYLDQMSSLDLPNLGRLKDSLAEKDVRSKLVGILEYLEQLKDIIQSDYEYEVREDIFIKRHIAVDIPSMYGSYHEMKFDALGLSFRLEALANTLFQELIDGIDLKLITRATFVRILDCVRLFNRALRLDGIFSREMEKQIDLLAYSLDIRGFSFTQYIDIFRGFSQVVSNLVNDHFNNIHHNQLASIISRTPVKRLLPKYLPGAGPLDVQDITHRATEIFLRDRIAGSLGLQQLDQLITRILNSIFKQDKKLPRDMLRRLLNYDPDKAFTLLAPVKEEISDVIHLGAKGLGLVKMVALGLPVPPGFIITTEVFRCKEVIDTYEPAKEHFHELLARQVGILERQTGRIFGDPNKPLLLSVRSGASISQPGMLATFLNVGINEDIVAGMAKGTSEREWFAWDCYRRFLQSFGMAEGLKRDDFDSIIADAKQIYKLAYKKYFSGAQMKETALRYKEFIESRGVVIEQKPLEQLYLAVKGVFDSWTSIRAMTFRRIMGISSDWGTAVTVQSMVFGNLSERSGAGVFFTHNPRWSGDKLMLWGDFAVRNQGEDVVSGLVETNPVNTAQAEIENRSSSINLETHFPEIYKYLRKMAKEVIYTWGYGPQEMEFTFEGPRMSDLYFLQTRDMVLRERRAGMDGDYPDLPSENLVGHGIGVSGGVMSGRIVFTLEEINYWRDKEPDTKLILIRNDTVPDDIHEIHEADGLLTARGGSTSHAAIVAYRLKKTCIVGCADLTCNENDKNCTIGSHALQTGDWIGLDGLGGSVYRVIINNNKRKKGKGDG